VGLLYFEELGALLMILNRLRTPQNPKKGSKNDPLQGPLEGNWVFNAIDYRGKTRFGNPGVPENPILGSKTVMRSPFFAKNPEMGRLGPFCI
jgi:hypothetical protein